jgi:hypothetical protein
VVNTMRRRLIAGIAMIVVGMAGLAVLHGAASAYHRDGWPDFTTGPTTTPETVVPQTPGPMKERPAGGPPKRGPQGSGDVPGFRGRTLPPSAGARVLEIQATDTDCQPREFAVRVGETINITLVNQATGARGLMLPSAKIRLVAGPGQSATSGLPASAPGELVFHCGGPGRDAEVTVGRIVVSQ